MNSRQLKSFLIVALLACVAPFVGATDASADSLKVTVTTTPKGARYAPKNVVAIWVESADGKFQKTIQRWGSRRISHLVGWRAKAGTTDADAVSGATRGSHATPLTMTWDLKNKAGTLVPDGMYTIRMELADGDSVTATQNNQGSFTFNKNGTSSMTTGGSNGGFTNVAIAYTAGNVTAVCNNGTLDAGEICDGNCPTSCAAPTDTCSTVKLVGSAATCNAICEETIVISACKDDDGCCGEGCNMDTDSDCDNGGTGNTGGSGGGCATSAPSSAWFMVAFGAIMLAARRRRRA